jgi:hypothetical protein
MTNHFIPQADVGRCVMGDAFRAADDVWIRRENDKVSNVGLLGVLDGVIDLYATQARSGPR